MDIFQAVLNVLGVLALVAVGAFLIVFLSDLLLSIIDRKNGIFFKHKGSNVKQLTSKEISEEDLLEDNDEEDELQLDYNQDESKEKKVDLDIAEKEEEMLSQKLSKQNEEQPNQSDDERIKNLEKSVEEKVEPLDLNFDDLEEEEKKVIEPKDKEEIEEEPDELDTDDELEKMYLDLINKINTEADSTQNSKEDYLKENPETVLAEMPKMETSTNDEEKTVEKQADEDEDELEKRDEEFDIDDKDEEELDNEDEELDNQKVKELEQRLKELNSLLAIERENTETALKQSEELKKQLKETVVVPETCDTLDSLNSRLEVLKKRLSDSEKNFKANKKEFIPLRKIKKTLEADKDKLRRKEAIVAKQKVLLFGVNNYVADPEKQKKLEQDLDVLDALRLSVKHCEDVMKENEDRYPILEKTHDILAETVADIKSDIEVVQDKIKKLQDK